jgi:hypothetical protein
MAVELCDDYPARLNGECTNRPMLGDVAPEQKAPRAKRVHAVTRQDRTALQRERLGRSVARHGNRRQSPTADSRQQRDLLGRHF